MIDDQNIEIVDSHHHFLDLDKNYNPFLFDKIDPDFFLGDYKIKDKIIFLLIMKEIQKIIMFLVPFIVKQNGIGVTSLEKRDG